MYVGIGCTLTHYNPSLLMNAAANASNCGLKAAKSHIFLKEDQKAFGACVTNVDFTENSYVQIEKSA